ncbi:MAG: bifunctional nuclease family protein [Planctomycetes bacterium]|mgnify:CR=1 FL=1|nr:bifunctional nuclease family protein [Planctomycetota bacterium]
MGLVECEFSRIVMSETNDRQIVVLKEKDGDRKMAIAIGIFEVWAIHRTVNNEPPLRPLTHELFGNVLDELGVKVKRLIVSSLENDTFYGRLILEQNERIYDIDTRPSDGMALAVQKGAPIFVDEDVLDSASTDSFSPGGDEW